MRGFARPYNLFDNAKETPPYVKICMTQVSVTTR